MATDIAISPKRQIARPLKVLVPLIRQSLDDVARAGLEYQRHSGELLIEAKEQVARGSWGPWLNRHFSLSARTARAYMQLAEKMRESENSTMVPLITSKRQATGQSDREREQRAAWRPLFEATREVDVETLAQTKQARHDEVELHRSLAHELIEIGYKALATRLHPDRGGSKDAMARLNRVREELNDVAATRRYV